MTPFKKTVLSVLILTLMVIPVFPADSYPLIRSLTRSDLLFQQLSGDIRQYYVSSENGSPVPPLIIFRYILKKDDTLFSVAARLNISIETIVTLNRFTSPNDAVEGKEILLPNMPGLFVNENPDTDLEYIIASWRRMGKNSEKVTVRTDETVKFFFLPGETFHTVERSFFFGLMFRFPLPKGVITSRFGPRLQPFTGKEEFHRGIDIAAPEGTGIMASRGGIIAEIGNNDICGNFILIDHESGYETKYCHLKKILVSLHQKVRSGIIIGEVGMTGMATGPHLHFEIRERGKNRDPLLMIQGK